MVAIPENFEIDFDGLFDLKQPCVMTPPLLESKVAAIAIIPREKLCKPVKFPQETCHYHWFSPKDAPVHNPQLFHLQEPNSSQLRQRGLAGTGHGALLLRLSCGEGSGGAA
jgi:hypothetical protein